MAVCPRAKFKVQVPSGEAGTKVTVLSATKSSLTPVGNVKSSVMTTFPGAVVQDADFIPQHGVAVNSGGPAIGHGDSRARLPCEHRVVTRVAVCFPACCRSLRPVRSQSSC